MRRTLTLFGVVLVVVVATAYVGVAFYSTGRHLVEAVGLLYAVLIFCGWTMAARIADWFFPRDDGRSWFWTAFAGGGDGGDGGGGG